jgi:hypothetical protein
VRTPPNGGRCHTDFRAIFRTITELAVCSCCSTSLFTFHRCIACLGSLKLYGALPRFERQVIFLRRSRRAAFHESSGAQSMRTAFAVLFCIASSSAFATPHCTAEPASKWLTPEVMKDKVIAMGHHIEVFKTTKGNCYEIYGKNSAGKNIELYFNPVTGVMVEDVK